MDKIVSSIRGDVRDLDYLTGTVEKVQPDLVVHLAAQPLVRNSYQNPVETYSINSMGTVNFLEAVRRCSSVRAVLNIISDKCYENKEWLWGLETVKNHIVKYARM